MRALGGMLIAVAAWLAMAQAAQAGLVSYSVTPPDHVTPPRADIYFSELLPGETNNMTVLQGASGAPITIRDAGALVLPNPAIPALSLSLSFLDVLRYCSFNLTSATCRTWMPGLDFNTRFELGTGNDRMYVDVAGVYPPLILAAAGNDSITVTRAGLVETGSGNDTVRTGGSSGIDLGVGNDSFVRSAGPANGALNVTCGDGVDSVQVLAIDTVAADCENVTLV